MISKVELPKEFALLCNIDENEIPGYIRKLIALELFREKKISLGKASEVAGPSVEEMMTLLREREITLNYSVEDLEKDLEAAEEILK
jgi:predicted HTH domain antitoxin